MMNTNPAIPTSVKTPAMKLFCVFFIKRLETRSLKREKRAQSAFPIP
jgi:hypothetical protein